MRKRPPPFALVLSVLVAGAVLAIVLTGPAPGGRQGGGHVPTVGIGPARACVTTSAQAVSVDRSAIVVTATAEQPVTVSEQASGPNGIATVTRSETLIARIRLDQPVEVTQRAGARARACAAGQSTTAAKAAALRTAYARALATAHSVAATMAVLSLRRLVSHQYRSVAASAQSQASARARRLAPGAEARLAAQAQSEARRRAGG